jgi:hypothetical protein
MLEIIFLIIFIIGLFGMGFMVFRKIPDLVNLPDKSFAPISIGQIVSGIKDSNPGSVFSVDVVLQKVLTRVRILILKSDNKTSNWIQSLRQRSKQNKFGENDTYWKDLKKMTRKK